MRGQRFTISQHRQRGVLRSAGTNQVLRQLAIEANGPFPEGRIVALRRSQQTFRAHAFAPPVRPQVTLEILNGIQIVVRQHKPFGNGRGAVHLEFECHGGQGTVAVRLRRHIQIVRLRQFQSRREKGAIARGGAKSFRI